MDDSKTVKPDVEDQSPGIDLNDSEDEFYVDPVKEVKLLAKLNLAFTPVIMLVYLSCFLDRSNIGMRLLSSLLAVHFTDFRPGNVKVGGLLTDIHTSEQQFSTAVSIFYATYVTFEVCKNFLSKFYYSSTKATIPFTLHTYSSKDSFYAPTPKSQWITSY